MHNKFTSLLFALLVSSGSVWAQSLEPVVTGGKSVATPSAVAQPETKGGKIQLEPTNKHNVAPSDWKEFVSKGGNLTPSQKAEALAAQTQTASTAQTNPTKKAARADAPSTYPDAPYVYGVLDSHSDEANIFQQGTVFGYYLHEGTQYYQEANKVLLPTADLGSSYGYVLVDGKWYVFGDKLSVYDAKTGEQLQSDVEYLNGAIKRPSGVGYDASTDNFYVATWSGILEVKRSDLSAQFVSDGFNGFPLSMTVAKQGIYYVNYAGNLIKYDKDTKESTVVYNKVNAQSWGNNTTTSFIDFATGKLYINYMDNHFQGHISEFDPETQTATKLWDYPTNEFTVAGFCIPYAADNAPAAVTNLNYADGKVTFTAPSSTYASNETLSGSLTAYITVNNGTPVTATVNAGEAASVDLSLADGLDKISVQVGNDNGKSPERVQYAFGGEDTPTAPTDVTLTIGNDLKANLTWTAPTIGENHGPFNSENLNYDIVRYPDRDTVAVALKGNSFSEQLPETRENYYYTITAHNGGGKGTATAQSNVVPAGNYYAVPYSENFYYEENWAKFNVIDRNKDGNTWKHFIPQVGDPLAWLSGNGVTDPETGFVATYDDDYLITPDIALKAGTDYKLSLNWGDDWYYTETMNIFLTQNQSIEDSTQLIADHLVLNPTPGNASYIFHVAQDGKYNVAFHANTVGSSVNIELEKIGVDLYSDFNAPDSVTSLKATAGSEGDLYNILSFNAPTKTYQGGSLNSISDIKVYRNNSLDPVHVFTNPRPGKTLNWVDTEVQQGSVTYKIVPFNENGQGLAATVTNWVGLDAPADVPTFTLKQVEGDYNPTAQATYTKVGDVGKHGGYVIPDDVTYTLKRYNEYNYNDHWETVAGPTKDLSLIDNDYFAFNQAYVTYLLVAENSAGSSDGYMNSIVIGEPYALPYNESFPNGAVSQDPWTLYNNTDYNYAWNQVTGSGLSVKPYDKDGGMLAFNYVTANSNKEVLTSPRISLANTTSPELSFYVYHGLDAEEGDLTLDVYTNYEDEGWVLHKAVVDYNNGIEGWSRYSMPLDSSKNDIQLGFAATAIGKVAPLYVDDITVAESNAHDLALENFSAATRRVEAGDSASFTVSVSNYGTETTGNYTVSLYRDSVLVGSQTASGLKTNDIKAFTFSVPTTKSEAAKVYKFNAVATLDDDTNLANDSSAVINVNVHGSQLPAVENFNGQSAGSSVTLSWSKPSSSTVADPATDDFEGYDNFIIDNIGDWTTYDGDNLSTVAFNVNSYDHKNDSIAWQVWDPVVLGFNLTRFPVLIAHSGEKYLASWAASDGIQSTMPSDDWLISPEVKGGTDVDFYYRNPIAGDDAEVFEMLYTTENSVYPEDYTVFDRDSLEGTTDWVHYAYTLPKDARHFAIRACSPGGNIAVAFLDDITYTPAITTETEVNLTGYNVYRDGEVVATLGKDQTSYTDDASANGNSYFVTAVYSEGESNGSDTYTNDAATAINELNASNVNGALKVRTGKGILNVLSANGNVTVFTAQGQRVAELNGDKAISLPAGLYLVGDGKSVVKVTVK